MLGSRPRIRKGVGLHGGEGCRVTSAGRFTEAGVLLLFLSPPEGTAKALLGPGCRRRRGRLREGPGAAAGRAAPPAAAAAALPPRPRRLPGSRRRHRRGSPQSRHPPPFFFFPLQTPLPREQVSRAELRQIRPRFLSPLWAFLRRGVPPRNKLFQLF